EKPGRSGQRLGGGLGGGDGDGLGVGTGWNWPTTMVTVVPVLRSDPAAGLWLSTMSSLFGLATFSYVTLTSNPAALRALMAVWLVEPTTFGTLSFGVFPLLTLMVTPLPSRRVVPPAGLWLQTM